MAEDNEDDGVGYRRAPKQHRFKKGQSGNPSGKKKGKSLAQYIAEVGDEEHEFLQQGKPVTKSLKVAAAERLYTDAVKGKPGAAKLVLDAESRATGNTNQGNSDWIGPEEFEVAKTRADWLGITEQASKEDQEDEF